MELKIEYLPIEKLRPYDKNARTHSESQVESIAASIREFGFTNPVLADDKNIVIAGHGRLFAAAKLGLKTIPVICLGHLSERQRRALTLADNRIALSSGWDFEKLADEISALAEQDFDLSLIGFDEQEISALLQDSVGILPNEWQKKSFNDNVEHDKSNTIVYENKEIDTNNMNNEMVLKLVFNEYMYWRVRRSLEQVDQNIENAIIKILNL